MCSSDLRRSPRLPEVELPHAVLVTEDAGACFADATLMLSAIPAQFAGGVWRRLAPVVPARSGIVTVTKGVEVGSMHRPTQVLREATGDRALAVLSGPTIAHELARRLPAVMVSASDDAAFAAQVQAAFARPWLRIYTSADPMGEIGRAHV